MYFGTLMRKVINVENKNQEWGCCGNKPGHAVFRQLKSLEPQAIKVLGLCKQSLIGHFSGILEERLLREIQSLAHEIPKNFIRNLTRSYSCHILTDYSYILPVSLMMLNSKVMNSFVLVNEISRQNNYYSSCGVATVYYSHLSLQLK